MLLRIHLLTDRADLVARLRRALAGAPIVVPPVAGAAAADPADLVLVPLDALAPAPRDAVSRLRSATGAEVVVLSPHEAAEERADLLAAGVFAVLPEELSERALSSALRALVERRRERLLAELAARGGGRGGPDVEPRSDVMRRLLDDADQVAEVDTSLLILGETGVGKEWLARRLHARSPRARGPFVALNCAAMPESLWESELFGHERGAFTGAERARRGHFELAHGGTLFLDEIGDLPVGLQAKLLRVLETRQVQRLGGERATQVDVRIVAASNRDLDHARAEGRFRDDLYYRLAVVVLTLPPLRERGEDVGALAEAWCVTSRTASGASRERCRRRLGRRSPPTGGRATSASWPTSSSAPSSSPAARR